MPRYNCARANYSFPVDQLQAILASGLEAAENVEALARKLFQEQLQDRKHEIIRGLQLDANQNAYTAHVVYFIESGE